MMGAIIKTREGREEIYKVLICGFLTFISYHVYQNDIDKAVTSNTISIYGTDIAMLKNLHLTRSPQPPERLKPPGELIQPERRIRIKDVEFRR